MKNIFWIIAAAFAFVACSDDDGPREKPFDGEVVSFEASEHLLDAMTGNDVKLGPVTMSLMGMGDYTYANAFCAKQYAVEADFDGMLFSTADQNLIFNAYYSSLYDGWGGIGLSQMPDRNAAAPSSKQQFSVWAEGGANATETYAVFYDSNSPTEMYPEYLSESGYPTIDLYFTGADTDSFQVKITGSLGGVEKGSITETLVAGKSKLSGWRKVDLSSFGAVDKLVFKAVCDYQADPTYFCIDEIGLLKPDAM